MRNFNQWIGLKKGNVSLVVVDIGTTKIAMTAGWFDELKKFHIIECAGHDAHGLFRGSIVNSQDIVNVLNKCLTELKDKLEDNEQAQKLGLNNIKEVVVGISSQNISSDSKEHKFLRRNKKEAVSQEDIEGWITEIKEHESEQEGKGVLHVVPQFYTIDDQKLQIKDPAGYLCNVITCHYHVVAVAKNDIEKTIYCLNQVGLTVKKIIFEPIASAASVLTEDEKEDGVALLDIGGGTSDLVVYHKGGLLFSTVLTLGGNLITEDIHTALGLTQNMAEKLKITYGSCIPDERSNETLVVKHSSGREQLIETYILSQIIEYRINCLLEAVFYKLFEENQFEERIKVGLVVTGGGSLIKNFIQAIKLKGLNARFGLPANHIVFPEKTQNPKDPRLSTLFGLPVAYMEQERKIQKKRNSLPDILSDFVFKD